MKEKRLRSLKVKVVQVLSKWQEPHGGGSYKDTEIIQSLEISDQGEIILTIEPRHLSLIHI